MSARHETEVPLRTVRTNADEVALLLRSFLANIDDCGVLDSHYAYRAQDVGVWALWEFASSCASEELRRERGCSRALASVRFPEAYREKRREIIEWLIATHYPTARTQATLRRLSHVPFRVVA